MVVDSAIALQQRGHHVSFLTNHHDRSHCFDETRNGQLEVQTVGDWLPRHIFGRFAALCAYVRMIYASLYTSFVLSHREQIDVIFCDQISLGIPILRLATRRPKILFYCHFPDQLLSQPGTVLKRLYRAPLNYFEEVTTGSADAVLVNSKFTRRIFKSTFRSLSLMPSVLYPSLNTDLFDHHQQPQPLPSSPSHTTNDDETSMDDLVQFQPEQVVFLSINRYERKKNLPLALHAFKLLETLLTRAQFDRCRLVIAGGYDDRLGENVQHHDELIQLSIQLAIDNRVHFLRSPTDRQKVHMLQACEALVYTPHNEHFGIVPVESMYMRRPVVAVNSGGPTETIIHESTGFLCDAEPADFARSMARFAADRSLAERMGEKGRKRVQQKFSFDAFGDQLECIVRDLVASKNY